MFSLLEESPYSWVNKPSVPIGRSRRRSAADRHRSLHVFFLPSFLAVHCRSERASPRRAAADPKFRLPPHFLVPTVFAGKAFDRSAWNTEQTGEPPCPRTSSSTRFSFVGGKPPQTAQKPGAKATGRLKFPKGECGHEWGQPSPLPNAEPPAISYPVNCLTPGLRKVVAAIAKKTQAPEAIAAQSVIAVVSLTFASRAKLQTLSSSYSNAACFFVLIALSGERKSATDRWAMGGVIRTLLELREEYAQFIKEHEQILGTLERGEEIPPRPVCPSFLVPNRPWKVPTRRSTRRQASSDGSRTKPRRSGADVRCPRRSRP